MWTSQQLLLAVIMLLKSTWCCCRATPTRCVFAWAWAWAQLDPAQQTLTALGTIGLSASPDDQRCSLHASLLGCAVQGGAQGTAVRSGWSLDPEELQKTKGPDLHQAVIANLGTEVKRVFALDQVRVCLGTGCCLITWWEGCAGGLCVWQPGVVPCCCLARAVGGGVVAPRTYILCRRLTLVVALCVCKPSCVPFLYGCDYCTSFICSELQGGT